MVLHRTVALVALAALAAICNPSLHSQDNPTMQGGHRCDSVRTRPSGAASISSATRPARAVLVQTPTSGWHTSGAFSIGIAPTDDPLTEPEQVSVLEAGGAVITFGELPVDDVQQLADLTQRYAGRSRSRRTTGSTRGTSL